MGHWIRFKAKVKEVRNWLQTQCCKGVSDHELYSFLMNVHTPSQLLLDNGAKITNRGSGWYLVTTYTDNDVPNCYPGTVTSASF